MKEQIAVIRKALGEKPEQTVSDALAEIDNALAKVQDLQGQIDTLQKSKNDADYFEKQYREAIKDTMRYKEIQAKATAKAEEFESKLNAQGEKLRELEDLRAKLADVQAQETAKLRDSYKSKLEALKDHPAYDRIKDKVILPTEENPLEKLSNEDLKKSLDKISEWEDLGLLGRDSRTTQTGKERDITGDAQEKSLRKAFGLPEKKKG